MFETWCNFSATKIASSCRDKNRLCKRAFKVPQSKNLVEILALKTDQFLSKNGQERDELIVQFHLVTWCCGRNWLQRTASEAKQHVEQVWVECFLWIFKRRQGYWCCVQLIHAESYCNLVVLSPTLRHQDILHGRAIRRPFLRAKSHNFQVL